MSSLGCPSYDWDRYCAMQDVPDVVELANRKVVAARKEHRCRSCSQPIPVGSTYWRFVYLEEGEFRSEAYHTRMMGGCLGPEDYL